LILEPALLFIKFLLVENAKELVDIFQTIKRLGLSLESKDALNDSFKRIFTIKLECDVTANLSLLPTIAGLGEQPKWLHQRQQQVVASAAKVCEHCFIGLASGYLGVANIGAKVGDCICILQGCYSQWC
jgi:hypothetical protein